MARRLSSKPTPNDDADALSDLGLEAPDYADPDAESGDPLATGLGENTATVEGISAFDGGRVEDEALAKGYGSDPSTHRRIIFMKMGARGQEVGATRVPVAGGVRVIRFTPFSITEPLPPEFVNSVTRAIPSRGDYGHYWQHLWLEPEEGNCGGKMGFKDKISGQFIQSCPYKNCPHHPMPKGIHHSVHQAHLFIGRIKSVSVIQRYVRDFDPRPAVARFANLVITHREAARLDAAGLGARQNSSLVN